MHHRLFMCLSLVGALEARAQDGLMGVIVEDRDRLPVACVDVALTDASGTVRARTRTSRDGVFRFASGDSAAAVALRISAHRLATTDLPISGFEADSASGRRYTLVLEPTDAGAAPGTVRADDAPPMPVARFIAPKYPDELRSYAARGAVVIGFVVNERGRADTSSAIALQATHAAFLESTLAALAAARFRPARRDGMAACAFTVFSFQFDHARP